MIGQVRRTDAVGRAYESVRRQLAHGFYPPGYQLKIEKLKELVGRISTTPVREALCRLAGEGLIEERPKHGFHVPIQTSSMLVDLLDLEELYLCAALNERLTRKARLRDRALLPYGPDEGELEIGEELLEHSRRICLANILLQSDNRALVTSGMLIVERLALARVSERRIFSDLGDEAARMIELLQAEDFGALLEQIHTYHVRRREAAEQLEFALHERAAAGE